MSLLERLDKAAKELDWKVIQSRATKRDHSADDLRKIVVDAAKEIRKLNQRVLDSYGVK